MLAKRKTDIDQYIIYYQMQRLSPESNDSRLFFCSYVTGWDNPNCSNAMPVCTVPGPILYTERNKPIEVAWVYNVQTDEGKKKFAVTYTPCMDPNTYNLS